MTAYVKLSVEIDSWLYRELKIRSAKTDVPMRAMVEAALKEWLGQEDSDDGA